MEYEKRLPVIGGLLEISKSKKGTAFLLTVIGIGLGIIFGIDAQAVGILTATALTYIVGQSHVDSKRMVSEVSGVFDEILDKAQG